MAAGGSETGADSGQRDGGMRIALTGGIGAGKSTVSARLAELGAVIIDSDLIAREVVAVGTVGLQRVVQRFGAEVLGRDGSLNRARLGSIVFADQSALADLNKITHPLVRERSAELAAAAPSGSVLVHDMPLLAETPSAGSFDEIVVVHAPVELRLERLLARGMTVEDARARMAQQASDEQRLSIATVVLDNGGSRQLLTQQIDALWQQITAAPS